MQHGTAVQAPAPAVGSPRLRAHLLCLATLPPTVIWPPRHAFLALVMEGKSAGSSCIRARVSGTGSWTSCPRRSLISQGPANTADEPSRGQHGALVRAVVGLSVRPCSFKAATQLEGHLLVRWTVLPDVLPEAGEPGLPGHGSAAAGGSQQIRPSVLQLLTVLHLPPC
jgi:hypothetical protein